MIFIFLQFLSDCIKEDVLVLLMYQYLPCMFVSTCHLVQLATLIGVYCVLETLILFKHMLLLSSWLTDAYMNLCYKKLDFLYNVKIKVCITKITLNGSSNPNTKLNLYLNLLVFILIFTNGFFKKRSKVYKPLSDN